MATASLPTVPDVVDEAADAPASGGKKTLTLIGAIAGLVLGGAVGALVIAPRLGATTAEVHVVETEHEGEPPAPAAVHAVENLVVNPANTGGSRFLLITVSIVAANEAGVKEIAGRDAEVRDRIVDFLSSKTVEQLGDPGHREALRTDLAASVGSLFAEGVVKRILLPQFVIQ